MSTRLTTQKWTPSNLILLEKYYPTYTWEELKLLFPFATKRAIISTANQRGWKRQVTKLTNAIHRHNEQLFGTWTEKSAYLLGYLEADGYCKVEGPAIAVQIRTSANDEEFAKNLQVLMEHTGKFSKKPHYLNGKEYWGCGFVVRSRHWKDFLSSHLRIGNVPEDIPKELLHHYIRGYFDGDGSIFYDRQSKSIHSNIVGNPLGILESLTVQIEVVLKKKKAIYQKTGGKHCWYINLAREDTRVLMQYLYKDATIYLERKRSLAMEAINVTYE
jgi:hypothetical protein